MNTLYFNPIIPWDAESQILNLPNNKAYGLYSSPVKLLKLAKSIISASSTEIFNKSILTGVYPAKLRYAKIVPVFKSEDETLPENYRPISLLSIYNLIFEKLMYNRLIDFVDKNNIICNRQYGIRNKHNSKNAVLDILHTIRCNMDGGVYTSIWRKLSTLLTTVFYWLNLKIMV